MDIVFLAARRDKGPTGGPGGVVCLCREILGDKYKHYNLYYYLLTPAYVKYNVYKGADKLVDDIKDNHKDAYFITHDIGTAHALAKYNLKYSLVFHHQGSVLEEITNAQNGISGMDADTTNQLLHWEKTAFESANSVHFPSNGASDLFFEGCYNIVDKSKVNLGQCLYNTILINNKCDVVNIEKYIKRYDGYKTILSVGTQTVAKGQDQIPKWIKPYLDKGYKIHWINVGDGVLTAKISNQCDILSARYPNNFKYTSIKKIDHKHLMEIYSYCDYYLMLHNISIFDFATLEAMVNECVIILSDVYGNKDFNMDDNIISSTDTNVFEYNKAFYKNKNLDVFNKYFSPKRFKEYYLHLIREVVKNV